MISHPFLRSNIYIWTWILSLEIPYSLTAQILLCYWKCSICSFILNQDHSIRKSKITVSGSIFRYNKTWLSNQTNSQQFSFNAGRYLPDTIDVGGGQQQRSTGCECWRVSWFCLASENFFKSCTLLDQRTGVVTFCVFSISFKHENTDILGIN